tara:strand:+ start:155 stop:1276 length:1122 start_codon:yes stop_codon:yes gene_type:complete
MQINKIVHLTTVHTRNDPRIFYKQSYSLAQNKKNKLFLFVADGLGEKKINNINILDLGKPNNILYRLLITSYKAYKRISFLQPDILHIHDPELIHLGILLKNDKTKIIYDSHEDFPKQLYSKPYLNNFFSFFLSHLAKSYQSFFLKKYNFIICATESIEKGFKKINDKTEVIKNYPEIKKNDFSFGKRNNQICYVGSISKVRGIYEILDLSSKLTNIKFSIAGNFNNFKLESFIKSDEKWNNINYHGFLNRDDVYSLIKKSKIGLVLLHPTPNHLESLPTKLFEYMSMGTPIICSDFKLFKKIINENKCGFTVDPHNTNDIINKINILISNKKLLQKFSKNGVNAFRDKYNWDVEYKKLKKIYNLLLRNIQKT